MEHIGDFLFKITRRLEKWLFVRVIRGGLMMIIPVLMVGAFSLIASTFPIPAYIHFITNFAGGAILDFFQIVFRATFGMLAVYMSIAIGYSYHREKSDGSLSYGTPLTALLCLFILSGVFQNDFSIDALGVKGMITAIVAGFFGSALYSLLEKKCFGNIKVYTAGADTRFNTAMSVIGPAAVTAAVFAIVALLILLVFGVPSFYDLIIDGVNKVFLGMGRNFGSGLLFVLFSSLLWFFGIHGSDCLEGASQALYVPAIDQNIASVAAGQAPTEILTKQFFDAFVLMGGCGAAMCLLIAIYLFGRRRSDRSLAMMATLPMVFNINEIMIFGLPVILNPVLFIPFLITPLVCYVVSYAALSLGLVGMTVSAVEWTTPVLLGGYTAVGSISGSLLQLLNLVIGVLIYAPFVRLLDRQKIASSLDHYERLVDTFRRYEQNRLPVKLTEMENSRGELAKSLVLDLKAALAQNELKMYYQPQYTYGGVCVGAEALLRWYHPLFSAVYPPLIIQLANEAGMLEELEKAVMRMVAADMPELHRRIGEDALISVNITGITLMCPGLTDFLRTLGEMKGKLCIEITEQTALSFDERMVAVFSKIKHMGIRLAIDDFSMGQTSINYLRDKHFDTVKLDGTLVQDAGKNRRSLEIIASITDLADTLGLSVLSEYVETPEQREMLHEAGCDLYQGYLYSPALPLGELSAADASDA